jgi:hypothetical protein
MKQALFILSLAATLACASAQEGHVYYAEDLAALVGQSIPAGAELTGDFVFLGTTTGTTKAFCSFTQKDGAIIFGNVLIVVRFPHGAPSSLEVGKIIRPNINDPLFIENVRRSPDGAFIYVQAIYQEKL